jgi:SEL1 protein
MAVVEQAFSYLNASASAGNADAQHLLAFMYSAGIGVEQHAGLALTHEFFAAAGGSRRASMALGYRHLRGIDVPKSCSAAREYFSAAAAGVVALLRSDEKVDFNIDRVKLRDVYEAGDVPERDADVRQYYTHAAVTGDAQAQLAMGQLCFYGAKGQPQDYAKALEYFTKAHKQGVLRATAYLGRMHYHAWGVAEKDYAQALAYFTEAEAKQGGKKQGGGAAVKGAVAASCGLGLMHLHGRGVVKNNAHALKYFKAAAARGSPEAQFQLGMMYVKGVGVAKQLNTALKYFSLSSQQGYTLAMHQLALMYYNGQGIQPSCEVGTQLMKTVAERGASAGDMTKAKERYADGMFTSSVMMYALLAEEGFETAQENAAWILDGEASALVFDTHPVLDTGVIAVPLATPSATSEHTGGADDGVGSGTDGVGGVEKEEEAWVVDGVQAYSPRKRLELAGRYYKLASGQGNAYAARQLGDYAYYGALGEVPDYSDAVKHYLLAAERKDAQASFNLGFMHEQGLGVSQDRHLSKRYYDDALTLDKHAGLPVQLALWKLQFDAYCESWLGDSASQLVARDLPWESITSEGVIRVGWTYYLLVEDYILVGSLVLFAVMIFSRSRQL